MRDYHYAPRTCLASIPGLLECWPQVKLGAHWLPGTTEYIIYYHCLVYGTGAQRINTETIAISKTMYITYTHNTNTHTHNTHTLHICVENLLLWWESYPESMGQISPVEYWS